MSVRMRVERAERTRQCKTCGNPYPKGTIFVTGYGYRDYGCICLPCIRNTVTALVKEETQYECNQNRGSAES
jgi:hypothetical protein